VDLAVIVTPAPTVPALIGECVDAGTRAAVVISAGFRERGAEGAELESKIREHLRRGSMRVIGPNCLGIMNPGLGLDATFAKRAPKAGNVAFVSQSGALLTAILDWAIPQQVGFSSIVSTGSMLDVGWGDLISHFGDDPETHSILLYMESVGDARSFLSAARAVALSKPIIVIKAGRSEAASRAAASHTGALTGSDEVLDAAFRRSGVLRVQNIADLFYMADVLSKQPRPRGPRLTMVTNAGGPAVLATDALVALNGELAPLCNDTLNALNQFLPGHWSHNNPIDILGDAEADRYARTLEIAAKDPSSDGVMVVLAPQGMTNAAEVAQKLVPYAQGDKPVLASFMGGESIADAKAVLNNAGIPLFSYPDTAAKVFCYMWRYSYNVRGLYETPVWAISDSQIYAKDQASAIIQQARTGNRYLLNEFESKQLLAAYGIPTVETRIARDEEEAVRHALEIGCPVVLKLLSDTITHKTDVGGVKLNLKDQKEVRRAYLEILESVSRTAGREHFAGVTVQPMVVLEGYELILGSSVDPQFGPVVLFGSGGELVEVYRDRALALPPLNTTLAQRLMEQTRIFTALKGVRGRKAVNLVELEKLLVRFSQLVVEQPWISEIDINPLLVSPNRLLALDARVVLFGSEMSEDRLPKPAIRPYPVQYVWDWAMKDGTRVTIRPIRPEDEPLMVKFHEGLSDRTVYLRYFGSLSLRTRVAHERLVRICFGDYDRELALVAERQGSEGPEIIGVGRLNRIRETEEAEVAVLVTDHFQNRGLGAELLRRAIWVAREEGITALSAEMMADNLAMQAITRTTGFRLQMEEGFTSMRARLELSKYSRNLPS
ncbi:MAG: bifunctional acetate--CoA ligase family protein/GNAT family N-acetyltransferase, partial [Acidobacteria bacterium]|nr:bifunctional acetate--CoA ligase family protein/GNAT family N-acetyltransferase [Acidobacteriota bacterium]